MVVVASSTNSEQKSLRGRKNDELFSIRESKQGEDDMKFETRGLWDVYIRRFV
jgi:hypothetical protein